MNKLDELRRENAVLRERISRLTEASLRINTSLDLNTVLREVVDSACVLTGARYGVIATIGEDGRAQEFVTSGLTPQEHEGLEAWPDGPRLFECLRDLQAPLRIPNLAAYVRELGFDDHPLPETMVQCTPMRHRGTHVGNFYIAQTEGVGTLTDEDEQILFQFAAQAATAIANARAFRKEQRTRADLEALIEISPVGVAVFNAVTGQPESYNREAVRIGEGLRTPGQSIGQLLEVITCRRGDGQEYSLKEFPLARYLSSANRVRAEEIVLSVPDGRHVTILVSATPIPSADDTVESLVATIQDLAPIEEIERMRAQFVSTVSHELRAPLMAIQGAAVALLDPSASVPPAEIREYVRLIHEQAVNMRGLISDLLDAGHIEAGTLSVTPELSDLAELLGQARAYLRNGDSPHRVLVDLPPDLPPVMVEPRRIVQVLSNLLTNAARHAPAASPIRITAERDGVHVAVSVTDQGRGMPPERLQYVFRKHTRDADADAARGIGTGLGLAICKGLVEAHGGRIRAESGGLGQGTRFTFTLPAAEPSDAVGAVGANGPDAPPEGRNAVPILVLDDDPPMQRYVRDALEKADYRPIVTGDHRELDELVRTEAPRLILLDLVLPGTDVIELMRRLPEAPVICMCAYGRDEAIADALQAGAADYIVKPFTPTELIARIGAVLRKRARPDPMTVGALQIDFDRRLASLAGRRLDLTATEFDLLRALALNVGRVLSYDTLIRTIWNGRGSHRLVRVYIKRLRNKLGDKSKAPDYIVNTRGVGYRLKAPRDL